MMSAASAGSGRVGAREVEMADVIGEEQPFERPAILAVFEVVSAHDDRFALRDVGEVSAPWPVHA